MTPAAATAANSDIPIGHGDYRRVVPAVRTAEKKTSRKTTVNAPDSNIPFAQLDNRLHASHL